MTSERHTTLAWSPLSRANVGVHGNDRKPLPDLDLTELAPLFAEWNAAQAKARIAYVDARRRADCQLPHHDGRSWCVCRARRRT